MKNTLALEQLKLFEKKLVEINNCKLKSNFDIRYLRSLYDLRCNVENVEESEEKNNFTQQDKTRDQES